MHIMLKKLKIKSWRFHPGERNNERASSTPFVHLWCANRAPQTPSGYGRNRSSADRFVPMVSKRLGAESGQGDDACAGDADALQQAGTAGHRIACFRAAIHCG